MWSDKHINLFGRAMRGQTLITTAIVAVAMGCGGDSPTSPESPKSPELVVEALTPTSIQDTVGRSVAVLPAVRITDRRTGAPLPNIKVLFIPVSGGRLTEGVVLTDALGVARAGEWNLPRQPGVVGLQVWTDGRNYLEFHATVVADVPARLSTWTRSERLGLIGEISDVFLEVQDRFSNPLSNIELKVRTIDANGTVTDSSIFSNAYGLAVVNGWTLGPIPGVNSLTITVSGIEPLVLRATSVDPSTVKWYTLESLASCCTYSWTLHDANIDEGRIGFTSLDGCACLRPEGQYLTTLKFSDGRSRVSSGSYRMAGDELFSTDGDWRYGKLSGQSLVLDAFDPWDFEFFLNWIYKESRP
jgi:hypothetical protein